MNTPDLKTWQAELRRREEDLRRREEVLAARLAALQREEAEIAREESRVERELARRFARQPDRSFFRRSGVRSTPVYLVILSLNIAIFVADWLVPGRPLTEAGIKWGPLIWGRGEWYRLLTAVFLHGGFLHILFNSYALYILGPLVERMIGPVRFLVVYLVAGLVGSALSLVMNPLVPSLGASGAIFGLMGYLVFTRWREPARFPRALSEWLFAILGINLVLGFLPGTNIDVWGHLGGLAGGLAAGFLVGSPHSAWDRRRTLEALFAAGAIFLFLAYSLQPPGRI